MMMDGKGCLLLIGIPTIVLLLIGLSLKGLGLVSLTAALVMAALPMAAAAAFVVWGILSWMASGSH